MARGPENFTLQLCQLFVLQEGGVFSDRDVDGGITSSGWLWFPVFCPVPIPALEMCVPWSLGAVRCLTSTLMMS